MSKDFDEFIDLMNTDQNVERRGKIIKDAICEFKDEDGGISISNGDLLVAIAAAMQDFTFDTIRQYHEWASSDV